MLKLWSFQTAAVNRAEELLDKKKAVLVVSPGGSGKTVMIAEMALRATSKYKGRTVILSHRKEIVEQTVATLLRNGVPEKDVGVIMSSDTHNSYARVIVASVATMARRTKYTRDVDLCIVDEAHHIMAKSYLAVTEGFPKARQVGFTATPFRLDGKGLRDFYDEMVVAAFPSELIKKKHLAQPVIYRAPEEFMPDLSDLKVAKGDYILNQLDRRVRKKNLVGDLVRNYKLRAEGKRALAFGVSIAHSKEIAERFNEEGVPAAHLDGGTSKTHREETLQKFRDGEILVVSNCLLLGEGYDLPTCEVVIMARPTKSLVMYMQQAARGMRYLPGKTPVLLDHSRLLETFGLPEADREFVLTTTKQNKETWGSAPVKDCPNCGASVLISTLKCPLCDHEFLDIIRSIPTETDVLLARYGNEDRDRLAARLQSHAQEHGYPDLWVEQLMKIWVGYRAPEAR